MRFLHCCVLLLSFMALVIAGCGGGGGGGGSSSPPTTKTATLKLSTQNSIDPAVLIYGFELSLTLPSVASLPIDASGTPLQEAVSSSGQFDGADFSIGSLYDNASHQLNVNYGSLVSHTLGEFITIVMTVPVSYEPNNNDIKNIILIAYGGPPGGNEIKEVTAKIESFN